MKTISAILLLALFASCDKPVSKNDSEASSQRSSCINDVISKIQSEAVRNPPAKVYSYQYNGQLVYFIPQYCCDIPSVLLDADCKVICSPDGGITGGGDGKCKDFFSKRTDEKLFWADAR